MSLSIIKIQEKYGLIYKTINLLNNKIYIGQTTDTNNYEKGNYIGSGKYFLNALKKYGKNNFKSEIIEYSNNQEELNNKEQIFIKEYNSIYPNGYNLMTGGNQGGKMHKVTREKISKSCKGRKFSESHLKNISERQLGIPKSDYVKQKLIESHLGIPRSDETKLKISKSSTGHKKSNTNKMRKNKSSIHKINISKSLIGRIKSVEHLEKIRKKALGTIAVKNPKTGEKLRIKKDDPRWISGELVGVAKKLNFI